MRKRIAAMGTIAIAFAAVSLGCRKGGTSDVPPPKTAAVQPAEQSGDTNFSPPEIRRPMPQEGSEVESKAQSADLVPAPTEKAAAQAPPAKSAPAAEPTPSTRAVPPAPKPAVAAPTAAPPGGTPLAEPGSEGDWVLQVNVQKSETEAAAQVAKLASEGVPAYSVVVPTEGGGLAGRYWRIRVGRFKSRAEAQSYGENRILPKGLKFWIDRKSNESRLVGGAG